MKGKLSRDYLPPSRCLNRRMGSNFMFQIQWVTTELDGITGESRLQRRGDRSYQLPTSLLAGSIHRPVPAPKFPKPAINQSAIHHHDDHSECSRPRDTITIYTQATISGFNSVKRDETDEENVHGYHQVQAELLPVVGWER